MPLTTEALERCGVPAAVARANLPSIKAAMREFDITTPQRARMFLAQVLHESMRLTRFEEIDSGARYEGNKSLGNTQPGDGVRFKGRGPIQITGRWNYEHFGKLIKRDLIRHPHLAAQPRHGWRLAAAFFAERCMDAADRGDFKAVTAGINKALLHLEQRQKFYEQLANVDVLPGRGKTSTPGGRGKGVGEKPLHADDRPDSAATPKKSRLQAPAEPRSPKVVAESDKQVRATSRSLGAEVVRLDQETSRAWKTLVGHGSGRRQLASAAGGSEKSRVSAILLRIEDALDSLVEIEQRRTALAPSAQQIHTRSTGEAVPSAKPPVHLRDLSDAELEKRIERLEQVVARYRAALIRRFARTEALMSKEVKR